MFWGQFDLLPKKCSNKLILSEYSVFLLNFLCFVVHIELVSYLNHSRNNFASLHVYYMFLHTLDLNRPFPLPLFIYLSSTSLSIERFPNIDSNASTTLTGQKYFLTKIFPYIFHIKLLIFISMVNIYWYKTFLLNSVQTI